MSTNTTIDRVSWVAEPEGRGTIGLLWSCFATIFLCTWNVVHPSLPGVGDSKARVCWRRFKYFVFCRIAPEYIALLAMRDYVNARKLKAKSPDWSLQKCFYLAMGGIQVQHTLDSNESSRKRGLRPTKYAEYLSNAKLPWPEIEDDDIEDHSKADAFVKTLALVQVLWFGAQLVGRVANSLAVSTLELFTAGIVLCAVVSYSFWWHKPFDVRRQTVVDIGSDLDLEFEADCHKRVSFLAGSYEGLETCMWFWPTMVFVCLAFGASHLVGWNFDFPSRVEQILWRISSIGSTIMPLAIPLIISLDLKWDEVLTAVTMSLYMLCRLYMLVEMFASLRSVPPSLYHTPQWSQYFPGLG